MKCPICDSDTNGFWVITFCRVCRAYHQDIALQWVDGELLQGMKCNLGLTAHFRPDGSEVPDSYFLAKEEVKKMLSHSEWYKWVEVVDAVITQRKRPEIPFQLSLFADWCADNGFPLQEQAVRQRLAATQEAEGR